MLTLSRTCFLVTFITTSCSNAGSGGLPLPYEGLADGDQPSWPDVEYLGSLELERSNQWVTNYPEFTADGRRKAAIRANSIYAIDLVHPPASSTHSISLFFGAAPLGPAPLPSNNLDGPPANPPQMPPAPYLQLWGSTAHNPLPMPDCASANDGKCTYGDLIWSERNDPGIFLGEHDLSLFEYQGYLDLVDIVADDEFARVFLVWPDASSDFALQISHRCKAGCPK